MDDSDAEHAWLREKRMRKPARLWRSARERAVWLRMTRAAETAQDASYCAYILCDRWVPVGGGQMDGLVARCHCTRVEAARLRHETVTLLGSSGWAA